MANNPATANVLEVFKVRITPTKDKLDPAPHVRFLVLAPKYQSNALEVT
ncbi:hypothetical protein [Flavobacterium crassostreae]|nr:hypothetical protein [Flavobacterium crassostreae]